MRRPAKARAAGAARRSLRGPSPAARRCRAKFLLYFPDGFEDETYVGTERSYKWEAHRRWQAELGRQRLRSRVRAGRYRDVAEAAVRIESRTNLLFSFEKMALRDAVRSTAGARAFARALYALLDGSGTERDRFEEWVDVLGRLPRRQTRVLTWPLATVFPFLAVPRRHLFLKPRVTQNAAEAYDFPFAYESRPNWRTYESLLRFAAQVRRDVSDLRPRDMIDLQSFLWVQGSDEYE